MSARPLPQRARSLLHYRQQSDFWALTAERYRPVPVNLPVRVERYDATRVAPNEDLNLIKGKARGWFQRFAWGHWCMVAYLGGEPVSYLWVSPGEWRLVDADAPGRLPSDEAFYYDAYTRLTHRGNGAFFSLLHEAVQATFAGGVTRAWGLIETTNEASRRVFSRIGFEKTPYWVRLDRYLKVVRRRRVAPPPAVGRSA